MLDTSLTGLQISTDEEPWKNQVSKPVNTTRVYRWKHSLEHRLVQFSNFYFHTVFKEYNYEAASKNSINDVIKSFALLVFRHCAIKYKKTFR